MSNRRRLQTVPLPGLTRVVTNPAQRLPRPDHNRYSICFADPNTRALAVYHTDGKDQAMFLSTVLRDWFNAHGQTDVGVMVGERGVGTIHTTPEGWGL